MLPYADADLLQANATVIAGVLIFLTVTPYARGGLAEIIERTFILVTILLAVIFFVTSIVFLSFWSDVPLPFWSDVLSNVLSSFFLSRIFFIGGLICIIFAIGGIMFKLPRPEMPRKE